MPDLTREEKIEGLRVCIEGWTNLARDGRRPGIGVYAERRLPEVQAALARHEALAREGR